ncbi:MAG TPA: hypothetical protein VGF35_04435 [Steroidobacteraceae bacterium]
MNTRILAALTAGCLLTGTALADTIAIGDKVEVRESQMATPRRGTTMSDVEKHFGAPTEKHPTVGQPPITRWDYNGFAVVFEHDRVIDSVVIGG